MAYDSVRFKVITQFKKYLPVGRHQGIVVHPIRNVDDILTVIII